MLDNSGNIKKDKIENQQLDSRVVVTLSTDKMRAYITLTANKNDTPITYKEIRNELYKKGIIHGLMTDKLQKLVESPVYQSQICIAKGTPPVNGKDGAIKLHFDTNKLYKPAISEDGRVDFRELNIVESVRNGQLLCTVIPPTKGDNGKRVTGEEIVARNGRPVSLPKGKNVELSEDKQYLISKIDGQVRYVDGKISVFPTYEVPGDVNNSTGNISFIGNVIVRGNVLSGFTVEAGGSVEIWGVVEGAFIKAEEDIILRRGMQGTGKGTLLSGGNIVAKYIENSNVEAEKDIEAEVIMHSNVKCGNKLILTGRKGLLVGGLCCVGNEISAKTIGSQMATSTEIEVGISPKIKKHFKELKDEIKVVEDNIKKSEQIINILSKLEKTGNLTEEKQKMLLKGIRTKVHYSTLLNKLNKELTDIEAKLQEGKAGRVHCSYRINNGTRITIGTSSINIKEDLDHCTIYLEGADIKVGPFLG
jgi:uncharacterized protein (DUF342 family)